MNPELRRYLWQELTATRLLVMPVFLAAVFFIAYKLGNNGPTAVTEVSALIYFLLIFLWGCRRSAASIATEVREATWEAQRMSAVGPWSMTWGKLLGSTVFPWYGGVICLAAIAVFGAEAEGLTATAYNVANLVLSGLLAQCLSFAAVLAWLRKWRPTRRLPVTLGQFLGLLVGLHNVTWIKLDADVITSPITIVWHGVSFQSENFLLMSLVLFFGWTFFAAYRLMGDELQVKSTPWGWIAFTFFLMGYCIGFFPTDATTKIVVMAKIWLVFSIALAACYLMLFLDPKNVVTIRALVAALTRSQYGQIVRNCPNWFSALLLAVIFGLVAALSHVALEPVIEESQASFLSDELSTAVLKSTTAFGFSVLVFLLRDAALILWLNIRPSRKRADLAAIFYLLFAYAVLPPALYAVKLPEVAALFFPDPRGYGSLASGSVQAAAMIAVLVLRWRQAEAQFIRGLAPADGVDGRS